MDFSHFTNIWSPRVTAWSCFQFVGCSNYSIVDCYFLPVIMRMYLISKLAWPHFLFVSLPVQVGLEFSNFWLVRVKNWWVFYFSQRRVTILLLHFATCMFELVGVWVIWRISSLFMNQTWSDYDMLQMSMFFLWNSVFEVPSFHVIFIYFAQDRFLAFSPEQHPIVLQIGGNNLNNIAKAVELAKPYGYDEINLKSVLYFFRFYNKFLNSNIFF